MILCAELISLLDGLTQQQQQPPQSQQDHLQNNSSVKASSSSLASLVTLKTLIKTAARGIRSGDWKSFLTIEKFTNDLFLSSSSTSTSTSSQNQEQQQQQQDEGKIAYEQQ